MFKKSLIALLVIGLMSVGTLFADNHTSTLHLDISGLSGLGPNANYEGWLIVNGAPVSTGVFDIDGTGITMDFEVSASDAAGSSAFVLTIEPANDPDPAPASTHVIAGSFSNGKATLNVEHPAALGNNFASASGSYIMAAPSGDNAPYYNGFWFLADGNSSLNLPTLPEGWAYEGWVVDDNGPVSTGTFTNPSAADSNGAGPAAGSNPTPNFPGEDFVNPARNLLGNTVVISIEPVPDNSPAPFDYKPLIDIRVDDTKGPGASQHLQKNLGSLATGTATFIDGSSPEMPTTVTPDPTPTDAVQVFAIPVGGQEAAPAFPGEAYSFSFHAEHGESLHLATMFVQSNDWFYSPNEWGIPLFDSYGNPKSGDMTDYIHLFDAGTEADEKPGAGAYQAPRQPGANTGPADPNNTVRRAHDNYGITPSVNQIIKATLTHEGGGNFTFTIENISAGSALPSPIAPGVAYVGSMVAPLFNSGNPDRGLGLEAIAEDGNPMILAGNLK